jgi:hypothetical protein
LRRFRLTDGRESATAIAAKSKMHADSRKTPFENDESPGELLIRLERRADDAIEIAYTCLMNAEPQRTGVESHNEEGGLLQLAGELAVAEG